MNHLFLYLFLILIIALFLWMFAIYQETKKLFGVVVARKDLHRLKIISLAILAYFGLGCAIFFFGMSLKVTRLYLDIAAFMLILPILLGLSSEAASWGRRKRLAGNVLLDLGRYSNESSTVGMVLGGLYILMAVVSTFSNFLKDAATAIQTLIYLTIWGSFGSIWLLLSLSHLEIREKGICFPFTVINWEKIAAYRWLGSQENTLCIRHQAKFPFFPLLKFKIPLVHKDRVKQLLSHYLAER